MHHNNLKKQLLSIPVIALVAVLSGCSTTPLEIKNLNTYQSPPVTSLKSPLRVGFREPDADRQVLKLVQGVEDSLSELNAKVSTATFGDNSDVDVVADVSIQSDDKFSLWNIPILIPGSFVGAPFWHGLVYQYHHNVNIRLSEGKTGKLTDDFSIPIVLNIRDKRIDSSHKTRARDVMRLASPVLSDYIAQKMAVKLVEHEPPRQ